SNYPLGTIAVAAGAGNSSSVGSANLLSPVSLAGVPFDSDGNPYILLQSGSLIGLAGNAFYTVTLGPVSAYPFGFSVTIANQNNNRGKLIAPTGGASFILWPSQTCRVIVAANGTWK